MFNSFKLCPTHFLQVHPLWLRACICLKSMRISKIQFWPTLYTSVPGCFGSLCELGFTVFVCHGDDNWRQAEAWNLLLTGVVGVNAHFQEALRRFPQWSWIEYPTFQLGGEHSTTELPSPPNLEFDWKRLIVTFNKTSISKHCGVWVLARWTRKKPNFWIGVKFKTWGGFQLFFPLVWWPPTGCLH